MNAPRSPLLSGPILPTLLRLSAPNLLIILSQAAVSTFETYFIGRLGTDALAGVSLVLPLMMLMQMMSAGAMGGGISSSIARALGGGRKADARALAWHAVLIAIILGVAFTLCALAFGPVLYRAMGGRDAALAAALAYSNVVFGAGAVFIWLMNSFASILRGTGDMKTPARVLTVGSVLVILASPLMIFGAGPLPGFGIYGGAWALVAFYAASSLVLGHRLLRAGGPVSIRPHTVSAAHFRDILKVGIPACIHASLINTAVAVATGFVGTYGTAAIAGYGIGARLELMQIPIVFGLGAALVAMIGTNIGAGQLERARRIAFVGGGLAAAVCGGIGLVVAIAPGLWAGLFSTDPEVLSHAESYLGIVGPVYGFLGLGMGLYFSFQGTGRMAWPLACVGTRNLLVYAGCAMVTAHAAGDLRAVFAVTAGAIVVFGAMYAWGTWRYFARP
jgi:putative MATE family efflux protein